MKILSNLKSKEIKNFRNFYYKLKNENDKLEKVLFDFSKFTERYENDEKNNLKIIRNFNEEKQSDLLCEYYLIKRAEFLIFKKKIEKIKKDLKNKDKTIKDDEKKNIVFEENKNLKKKNLVLKIEFQNLKKEYDNIKKQNFKKFSFSKNQNNFEENIFFGNNKSNFGKKNNDSKIYKDKYIGSNSLFSQRIKKIKKFNTIKKL